MVDGDISWDISWGYTGSLLGSNPHEKSQRIAKELENVYWGMAEPLKTHKYWLKIVILSDWIIIYRGLKVLRVLSINHEWNILINDDWLMIYWWLWLWSYIIGFIISYLIFFSINHHLICMWDWLPSGKRLQKMNWKDSPCYSYGKTHYFDSAMA